MISYVAALIERVIQYVSPSEILDGDTDCAGISFKRLNQIYFAAENTRNEATIEKSIEYLAGWIKEELLESGHIVGINKNQKRGIDFYDLVECLSDKLLTTMNGEIVFLYKYMELWQRLSSQIGSDMFVANAYAFHDFKYGIKRNSFLWKPILDHDNYTLNCILKKGVSDNHYHLKASMPYFDLSWISLMNSVTQMKIFKYLDILDNNSRNIRMRYITDVSQESYAVLHMKAALVRVYLYAVLTDQLIQLEDYQTPVVWLLENLMEIETPDLYLRDMDFSELAKRGKTEIGESMKMFFDSKEGMLDDFRKKCPGICWFFMERFPGIPIEILREPQRLTCESNFCAISDYVENCDRKLLLRECRWMFPGLHFEKYKAQWKQKTKEAVYLLLKSPEKLVTARKYIQTVLDTCVRRNKDYLLNETAVVATERVERSILSGERWLMYMMFRNRYQPIRKELEQRKDIYDLFFFYLLIKDRFRRELLYNNEKIGFNNFLTYQNRKAWFTTSFTKGELARNAVREAFQSARLKSLELRIMPENTARENIRTIQKFDKAIRDGWKEKYFDKYYYVFHFGKKKEELPKDIHYIEVRNAKLRRELVKKTEAILLMRERNWESGSRLKGVDACTSEDGCRPEVFACAFRVLKNHIVSGRNNEKRMPQLRLSYHVGEENQDVLDGLRAIDEAVYFLNLGNGDRLGHATMLGVNAAEWYRKRDYMISIRQQDYLDNVAWLYQQTIRYQLPNQNDLLEYLEKEFHVYFERIYREALDKEYADLNLKDFDIYSYYAAWELRGDQPEYYKQGHYSQRMRRPTMWEDYGVNGLVMKEKRYMEKATLLYHAYHYSRRVRESGKEPIVKKIPLHLIRGIQEIQKRMMKKIARKGIAIETNPSSNVLIGGVTYGRHPIVSFYNKGLTNNVEDLNSCAQICVSINTDDSGVFITSLTNEYALIAKAMESLLDEEGNRIYKKDMVYDWINRIRKMGNEQSFRKI